MYMSCSKLKKLREKIQQTAEGKQISKLGWTPSELSVSWVQALRKGLPVGSHTMHSTFK